MRLMPVIHSVDKLSCGPFHDFSWRRRSLRRSEYGKSGEKRSPTPFICIRMMYCSFAVPPMMSRIAACPLHREQIRGWEVSQDLDEQFSREIEKSAGWIHRGGDSDLILPHYFVFAI